MRVICPQVLVSSALRRCGASRFGYPIWCFAAICLVFGSIFAFVTPPDGTPDELDHQIKIARVAGGNLFGADRHLPLPNFGSWYGAFTDFKLASGETKVNSRDIEKVTAVPLDCRSEQRDAPSEVTSYSPVLCVLPALTYRLACATGRASAVTCMVLESPTSSSAVSSSRSA